MVKSDKMSLDFVRGQACLQFATMFAGKSPGINIPLKEINIDALRKSEFRFPV